MIRTNVSIRTVIESVSRFLVVMIKFGATNPSTVNSGRVNSGTANPGTANPGVANPGVTNPGTANPGTANPGTVNSGMVNSGTANPGTANPGTGTWASCCAQHSNMGKLLCPAQQHGQVAVPSTATWASCCALHSKRGKKFIRPQLCLRKGAKSLSDHNYAYEKGQKVCQSS
jgi:PPE-repeat protein